MVNDEYRPSSFLPFLEVKEAPASLTLFQHTVLALVLSQPRVGSRCTVVLFRHSKAG